MPRVERPVGELNSYLFFLISFYFLMSQLQISYSI